MMRDWNDPELVQERNELAQELQDNQLEMVRMRPADLSTVYEDDAELENSDVKSEREQEEGPHSRGIKTLDREQPGIVEERVEDIETQEQLTEMDREGHSTPVRRSTRITRLVRRLVCPFCQPPRLPSHGSRFDERGC